MKSYWFLLISVILAVWCIVVDAERLQESERSFRDLLKSFENETTDGNDDWCSEWCTYSGETFVRPDLTAYCTCEGSTTLTKVKRYCETGQVYNETLRRCHRLEGGGMPTCVLHGRTCPEGELGTREYPDGEFYENYLVCLEDAVIVASCAIGYHYESESGVCVKGDRKVTIVGRKDCPLAPDVQCEEIGTKAMQLHVKDRSVLERCGQCYYICNERNLTHYDLLLECVHNTSHITHAAGETVIENIAIIEQSDEAILPVTNKTTLAPVGKIVFTDDSLETIVTSKERHTEILEETKPDVLKMSEVVGQTAIPQLEVVVIDKEHQKITEMDEVKKSIVIETGTSQLAQADQAEPDVPEVNVPIPKTSEDSKPPEFTETILPKAHDNLRSSEHETRKVVITEEIESTEITEERVVESKTIAETSEIVLTDQEQGDVPEVKVPITETPEEMITEEPELSGFPEGALPEANINLHNSEDVLTNKEYQNSPELDVPTTETPELVKTEEITSTEIIEESETIAETTEIVLITEKQRDVPVVKVPIQETSEKAITENPEPIDLTEDMSPGADSVVNSSEDVITDEEYHAVPELVEPTTETPALVTTEEIALTEITEMTILELETITETSEIVLTDEEIGDVPEVQVPISKTPEEMITEEPELTGFPEGALPEANIDLHNSDDVLTNKEYQNSPELDVPTTETPELVETEEIASTEITEESETIAETTEIVLITEKQRDVPEVKVPIQETSEEVITENPEPIELTEGMSPGADSVVNSSEDVITDEEYQAVPELDVPTTETPVLVTTEEIASSQITEITILELETITETSEIALTDEEIGDVPEVQVPISKTSEEMITEERDPIKLTESVIPEVDSDLHTSEEVLANEEHQKIPELTVPTTEIPELVITEELLSTEMTKMTVLESGTITETSIIVLTNEEQRDVPEVEVPITEMSEEVITEEPELIELTKNVSPDADSVTYNSEEILPNEEHETVPELDVPTTDTPKLIITEEIASTEITEVTVFESETITETSEIVLTDQEIHDVPEVEVPITETLEAVITEEPETIDLTEGILPEAGSELRSLEDISNDEEHQKPSELAVPTMKTIKVITSEKTVSTEITEVTVLESETITEISEIVLTDHEQRDIPEVEIPITETSEELITKEPEVIELTKGISPEPDSVLKSSEDVLTDGEYHKVPGVEVPTTEASVVIITEESPSTEITEVIVVESETTTETSEIVITEEEIRNVPKIEVPNTEILEDVITEKPETSEGIPSVTDSALNRPEGILIGEQYLDIPELRVPTTETPAVIVTEESPSTEITEVIFEFLESKTTTDTLKIVLTDQEQGGVPEVEVPITGTSEEMITETPEAIEITEGIILEEDSELRSSEDVLTTGKYQTVHELGVPTTKTSEVFITEEIASTEITEVTVLDSETITETSEVVLTDQEIRDTPKIKVPITEISQGIITEEPEVIELTEGTSPEADNVLNSSEGILTDVDYQTVPELVVPTTLTPKVIITEEIASTEITEVTVLESESITERSEVVLIDQKIPDVPEVEVPITEISEEVVTEAPEPTDLTEGILPEADSELRSSEDILTDEEHQKVPELAVPITETSEVIITEEIASAEITEVTVLEPETTTEISETVLTDQEIRDVPEAKVPITETSEEVVTEEPKSIELTEGILPEDLPSSEDIFTNGDYHTIPELVVPTTETPVVSVTNESPLTDINEVTVLESETVTETSGIVLPNQEQRDVPKFEVPITEISEEMITKEPELLEITEGISAETDSILNSSEHLLIDGEYQKDPELGVTTTETPVVFVTEESPSTLTVLESESITETSEVVLIDQELPRVPEIKVPITETPGEVIELIEITEGETEVTVTDVDNQEAVTVTVPVKETVIVYNEPVNTVPSSEAIEEGTEVTILESGIQQVTQLNGLITVTPEIVITEKPELTLSYEITEGIKRTTETSEVVLIDQELPSVPEIKVPITEAPEEVIEPIEITEGETEVTVTDVDNQEAATVTVPVKETIVVHNEPVLIPAVTVPASEEAFEEGITVTILDSGIQQVTQLNGLITVTPEIVITEKSELSYEITEDIKQTTETTVTFQILNDSETSEIATTEQDEPILTSEIENIESGTVQQPIEIKSKNTSGVDVIETSSQTSETVRINEDHQEITTVAVTERSEVSDPTTTAVVVEETSEIIVHYPRNNSTKNSGGVDSMVGPSQVESCKIYKYRPCEKEGFFRYRNSCTQHYQCFHSKTCGRILASRVYECPGCLKFNQALMTCDLPENVPECVPHDLQHRGTYRYVKGYRTTDPMSTCTGPGRYPDPGDPSRYYECVDVFDDGVYRLTVNICPLGGKFDWSRGACARGEVRAQSRSVPRCMSSGYAYDRFDCHKFYLCEDGAPRVNLFCTDEYVFNGYYCQHKTKSVLCNWESLRKYLYKPR